MKSYLRFLSRNKLYTAIEVVGLSVALAFVLVTGCFVWEVYTKTWDIPGHRDIYMLNGLTDIYTHPILGEHLDEIPHISQHGMYQFFPTRVRKGDMCPYGWFGGMDLGCIEMFPQEFIAGDDRAIRAGHGIILVRSIATAMFGSPEEAVGQHIEMKGTDSFMNLEVTGVIEDLTHSIFTADLKGIVSTDIVRNVTENRIISTQIFVRTDNMISQKELSERVHELIRKYIPVVEEQIVRYGFDHAFADRLDEIYLKENKNGMMAGNAMRTIMLMLIISIVMLISAILNYINLSFAQTSKRSTELATMQLVGSGKGRIIARLMTESIAMTTLCAVIGFLLAKACLPAINSILPEGNILALELNAGTTCILLITILLTGGISGIAPALLAMSFKPVEVTKGAFRTKRKMTFEKIFICIQTTLAAVLLTISCCLEAGRIKAENVPYGIGNMDICIFDDMTFNMAEPDIVEARLRALPSVKSIGFGNGLLNFERFETVTGPDGREFKAYAMVCDTKAFNSLQFDKFLDLGTDLDGSVWFSRKLLEELDMAIDDVAFMDTDSLLKEHNGLHPGGAIEELCIFQPWTEESHGGMVIVEDDLQGAKWWFIDPTGDPDETMAAIWSEIKALDKENLGYTRINREHNTSPVSFRKLAMKSLYRALTLARIFTLLSILLSILGMIGISAYYAAENSKGVAIRKVFGSTITAETVRNTRLYMALTLVSCIAGLPVGYLIVKTYLERYIHHLESLVWPMAVAAGMTFFFSLAAVLWQTLRAARTNPAEALKKE